MRSYSTIPAIALILLFAGCRSETQVEHTTAGDTTTAYAVTATDATLVPIGEDLPPGETTTTVGTITGTVQVATPTTATSTTTTAPVRTATQPSAAQTSPATPSPTATVPATPPPAAPPVTATTAPAPTPATSTAPATLPKTHSVNHGGAMHPPNMENPTQRCGACHGKDLRGGRAVSCYSCHETAKW